MAGVAKELRLATPLRFQSSAGMHRLRRAASTSEWLRLDLLSAVLLDLSPGFAPLTKGSQH
jgi:hypothetical protein